MLMKKSTIVILIACVTAVLLRIVPLPLAYNFSALGALALLSGSLLKKPLPAIAIVLSCRLLTDICIEVGSGYGFYDGMAFDYTAYALITLWGMTVASRNTRAVLGGAVSAGAIFFLVSNFGVWWLAEEHHYAANLSGLLKCYVLGLPFAGGTFFGDVLFSCVFFGLYSLVARAEPADSTVHEPA